MIIRLSGDFHFSEKKADEKQRIQSKAPVLSRGVVRLKLERAWLIWGTLGVGGAGGAEDPDMGPCQNLHKVKKPSIGRCWWLTEKKRLFELRSDGTLESFLNRVDHSRLWSQWSEFDTFLPERDNREDYVHDGEGFRGVPDADAGEGAGEVVRLAPAHPRRVPPLHRGNSGRSCFPLELPHPCHMS